MIKSIYKITNIINNKVYIGQSNNPQKRWKEHIRLGKNNKNNKNSKLYSAINKYGINNFIFEIIEENIKNYNEREKYWIKYYNSIKNGYNICIGGEEPPIHYGEDSILSKYSNLSRLNQGITLKHDNIKYPIRNSKHRVYK